MAASSLLTAKEFAEHALGVVHTQHPTDPEALTRDTVQWWQDHVNAGFLRYRKSMGDGVSCAKLDWRDLGGIRIADAHNDEYLDFLSGFGIFGCGHSHPRIIAAVAAQLHKQPLHSQEFLDPLRAHLARLLALITPGNGQLSHSFFVNSGAEAVEAALKLAILHTKRARVLACVGGFHGKTLGALATTSKAIFREPFVGVLMDIVHVPYNDAAALAAAFDTAEFTGARFAACIIEPVLGEGGIVVATPEFLRAARTACTATGTCLVFDEVQSGLGKTGRMFACEHSGVVPDLLCLGKSLSGGVVPIAACCGRAEIWARCVEAPFLFTTTFGGNPLACAAAIATIHVLLSEDLVGAACERGAQLKAGLEALRLEFPGVIKEVRGAGLMLGVEFTSNALGVAWSRDLLARRVLVSGTLISATTVRVCPPLVVSTEDVDLALARMRAACEAVRNE